MQERFDHIIVGGGTAGCVLADRLSAAGRSVLLLEAGPRRESPWVRIPAGFSKLMTNPRHNWRFHTEPEPGTGNRTIAVPRGKGLGGSTLINGMIYVRGQPQDYDRWAQLGCTGWGFADVAPLFHRLEAYTGADPDGLRGREGPLTISEVRERPAIAEAFIAAGEAAGYPRNPDYNGASQDGFGVYQVNQKDGRRVSAADAWLRPAMRRPNLAVFTHATARRIVLADGRAQAVQLRRGGQELRIAARREILLAAGAIKTPQLLELSGIGRPEVLADAGVEVVHPHPRVGENYLDHFCTRMNWRVRIPGTLNEETRGWRLARAVAQYALSRRGVLTFGTGLAYGFVRTREGLAGPDVQYFFMHASYANAAERKLHPFPGMTLGVTQLRPESRGTIHIVAPDADRQPAIRPNFLATAEDRRVMVEGMKIGRRVIEQAPMDAFREAEMSPGPDCRSDDDWLEFARNNGQTIYHAVGTCAMGGHPDSVLDPSLCVRGVAGLRVVDASAIPEMVSGNTQAAVMMLADRAADLVLQDARGG